MARGPWGLRKGNDGKTMIDRAPVTATVTPRDTGIGALVEHKMHYTLNPKFQRRGHYKTVETAIAVERAVGLGLSQEQIAYLMGVKTHVLRKQYKDELASGGALLHAAVSSQLASIALDPSDKRAVDAAKFILSRRFGWKETTAIELDANVQSTQTIDARALSPEARGQLRELLVQALAKAPALEDHTEDAEYEEVDDDNAEDLL